MVCMILADSNNNICVAERPERGHEDKKTDKTKKPRNKVLKDFIPRPLSF